MRPASLLRALLRASLVLLPAACGGGEAPAGPSGAEGAGTAAADEPAPELALPFATEADAAIDFLGRVVPDVGLTTLPGEPTTLFAGRGERVLVVAFTQVGCPVAQRYGPALARLHGRFSGRGVGFVGVDESPLVASTEVSEQAARLGLAFPILRDERQELLRALDVRTSTEVLVLDAQRRLCYRGAIDDRLGVGTARAESEHDYLEDALEAVLAGKTPAVLASDAPGCILTRLPEAELEPLPEPVTYYEHVAPILQENCVPCHRSGQVAPFELTAYEDAYGRSEMIGFVVRERIMPPWSVSRHFDGEFSNELGLTERERATLLRWAEGGRAAGDPELAPAPREWPEGWTLADLDLVLEPDLQVHWGEKPLLTRIPAEGFRVPAEGVLDYQDLVSSHVFEEEQWISGVEILPSEASVVHHAILFVRSARLLERNPGQRPERDASRPDAGGGELGPGYSGFYVPGTPGREFPEGYAQRIPAGSILLLQMHYTPDGAERFDRPRIGLRLARERPRYEVATGSASDDDFVIPPHAVVELRGERRLPFDLQLVGFMPHMHYRGRQFRFLLERPDGSIRTLLNVDYQFDWQMSYTPREPIPAPAGSRILGTGIMDNSAANPRNPDPSAEVRFGRQSTDEMFLAYFDYAVPLAPAGEE
jgi:peroxiredoxin